MFVLALAGSASAQLSDSISGKVIDAEGSPVQAALVGLLDAQTGMPMDKWTQGPFDPVGDPATLEIWSTKTDSGGNFKFDRVPDGDYRVVAQSWSRPADKPLAASASEIRLRGVADDVRVPSSAAERLVLKPLGNASAYIKLDPESGNRSSLMLLSVSPPRGDAIMGFLGWGSEFAKGVIGVNRMPYGRTLVLGLPDQPVHVAVLAPDNSVGYGRTTIDPANWSADERAFAEAWWRHAKFTSIGASTVHSAYRSGIGRIKLPSLTDPIYKLEPEQLAKLEKAGDEGRSMLVTMLAPLDREVKLPSNQTVTVQDLLLAQRDSSGRSGPPLPPTIVPMVATWTEAHHFPSAELERIIGTFRGRVPSMSEITGIPARQLREIDSKPGPQRLVAFAKALPPLDKLIQLPDGSRARLIDAMAARAYAEMHADFARSRPQWWVARMKAHEQAKAVASENAAN